MTNHRPKVLLILSCLLLLSGCAVGPNFVKPEAKTISWQSSHTKDVRSELCTAPVDSVWWNIFNDPELSNLEKRVVNSNLDIKTAISRLQQSRALLDASRGDEFPSLNANGQGLRQQTTSEGRFDPSGQNGLAPFNHWKASFDASWELDIWGRVSRAVEAETATVEATEDMLRGVLVSVLAETARDYIELRGIQRQQVITQDNLDVAEHTLKLTRVRRSYGVATDLEVSEAHAHVATVQSRLPILKIRESHLINALSYLLSEPPRALEAELSTPGVIPVVPSAVPVGLPSQLAERRPDILRAEAELHAATARIGVAKADFYPRISLTGNFGFEALQLSSFGNWNTRFFGIGPAISLPIFEGGRLRAMLNLREKQQQEAAIHYQQIVLKAWSEVDDAMTEYQAEQQQDEKLNESLHQIRNALVNVNKQYISGAVSFLNVLIVQQSFLSTQIAAIKSQTEVDLSLINLYKSLGGGW